MAEIPFTQYMRPDGRPMQTSIVVRRDIYEKAKDIINQGNVFECEVLTTGQISLTITDPEEGDIAIRVVSNGPEVVQAVYSLVEEFHKTL